MCEDGGGVAGITPFCVYTLQRCDGEDGGLRGTDDITELVLYVNTDH